MATRWSAEEVVAADELLERFLRGTCCRRCGRCNPLGRAVRAPVPKRKRKVAGRKIAPLISTPEVAPLSDSEWQPFLHWLPSRLELTSLRSKLDSLMTTYLGVLEAESASPSAREVAMVLERIARPALFGKLRSLLKAPRQDGQPVARLRGGCCVSSPICCAITDWSSPHH